MLTFYQAFLQRVHNEKSIKPLCQIDLGDRKGQIYIYIQNNGVGPMIIYNITFIKNASQYNKISDCLNLDSQSYWHIEIDETNKKVITSNSHLVVFEKNIENHLADEIDHIRKELTPIRLKVDYRDIYDNKFSFEKNLEWFSRHIKNDKKQSSLNSTILD